MNCARQGRLEPLAFMQYGVRPRVGATIPRFPQSLSMRKREPKLQKAWAWLGKYRRTRPCGAGKCCEVKAALGSFTSASGTVGTTAAAARRLVRSSRACSASKAKNRSVQGLPTLHNSKTHVVRDSVHIDCLRNCRRSMFAFCTDGHTREGTGLRGSSTWRSKFPPQRARGGVANVSGLQQRRMSPCGTTTT